MQEQINEKISLFIDDELGKDQALSLLRKIKTDEELNHKLQRYQLLGQILKHENGFMLDAGFSDKIRQQISQEPALLIPRKKPVFNWRKSGLAIAASIILAVVWLTQQLDEQAHSYRVPAFALNFNEPMQAELMTPYFNDYLQTHDNLVYYNTVEGGRQPLARVVDFHRE